MKSTLESTKAWLERLAPGAPVYTFDVAGPMPHMLVAVPDKIGIGGMRGDYALLLRFEQRDGEQAYVRGSVVSSAEASKRIRESKWERLPANSEVEELLRELEEVVDVSGPTRGRMAVTT